MGVRGLSGHDLAALAVPAATRTPAATNAKPRNAAAEHAASRLPSDAGTDAAAQLASAQAEKAQATRESQVRQEQAATTADIRPVLAQHEVRLHMDNESKRVIAQLVDETNTVIKQIPPQELLEIAARFRKVNGLIFDQES